ncbi:MAG TPA: hypothetical protein VHO48_07950, partial [Anaerolineaceae bacterium]|nr:hypothetical protein [Anaerolineaceae bacterium]
MTNLRNMDDLIIIIPGVMGSVLQRSNGQEAWGCKGGVFNNLVTLGKIAKCLALRADIGDSEPQDGVTASGLMPGLHLLPGFWGIDGYNEMIGSLRKSFNLHEVTSATPGNLLLFPYDWRLSNRVSAQKLKETAERELDRWREHKKNKNAKLILICHSMGGLVARWFLEVLGGRMITKHLVTLGTPYQGSIDALSTLANGLTIDFGPIGVNLTELVRSLPSVYQLLPTYHCVDPGDKQLRLLTELKNVPNLDARRVENAAAFHYTIAEEIKKRSATGETAPYQITAIQGIKQPTAQSALLRTIGFPNPIQPIFSLNGDDWGGDGTVPRPSSRPPEFG